MQIKSSEDVWQEDSCFLWGESLKFPSCSDLHLLEGVVSSFLDICLTSTCHEYSTHIRGSGIKCLLKSSVGMYTEYIRYYHHSMSTISSEFNDQYNMHEGQHLIKILQVRNSTALGHSYVYIFKSLLAKFPDRNVSRHCTVRWQKFHYRYICHTCAFKYISCLIHLFSGYSILSFIHSFMEKRKFYFLVILLMKFCSHWWNKESMKYMCWG